MAYIDDPTTQTYNSAFIRESMNVDLLERSEERALLDSWLDQHDEKALHKLVTAHHRLVIAHAAKFRHYGLPMGDLIQEGMLGLLHAANKFDRTQDVRFGTYAAWWIRSSLQDYILRNWSIVRTGTTAAQKSLFFNMRRLRAQIEKTSNGTATQNDVREQIAQQLQVPLKDVTEMEQRFNGGDASLNAVIGVDGDEEWQALLPDHRPNPEEIVTTMRDAKTRSKWLNDALSKLSDREQTIIRNRHLSARATTLEDLGIKLGVSKERVRQIETRAMEKLRDEMAVHMDGNDAQTHVSLFG